MDEVTRREQLDRITPTGVVVAWRHDDRRAAVADFVRACEEAVAVRSDLSR